MQDALPLDILDDVIADRIRDIDSYRKHNGDFTRKRMLDAETAVKVTLNMAGGALGDELIYSFHPELPHFYGKYYGNYVHFINIPDFIGEEKLTIVYDPMLDIDWTAFRDMELSLSSTYFRHIMQNDMTQFLICFTILLAGVLIVMLGFIFDKEKERLAETVSLGTIAVVLACYSNTGSLLIQAITQNSAVPRVIEIVSLALLPIPVLIFIASITDCLDKWWMKVMITLPILNLIVNFVLVRNTSLDFHDILGLFDFLDFLDFHDIHNFHEYFDYLNYCYLNFQRNHHVHLGHHYFHYYYYYYFHYN